MPVTREDYISQYGVDPDTGLAPEAVADESTTLNHLKSAATGVLSIPTDLYSLPSIALSGGQALYRSYANDTKFLDEFSKDMQVDDAQKNIQTHLNGVAQQWQQQNPDVTQEEINAGLLEYQKSKQYEDFKMEQLNHAPYVAAKTKDSIRKMFGDNRTEEQRPWTESAAEVLGGAVVGGPGGWATGAASAGARAGGIAAKITASPITRGALKTAEVLTPATVPYTGANIALNAGAGLAIDQGLRYAQGKSTAFTPSQEDSAGVGTLAATGAGVAGFAAFVAAVKGRSAQAIRNATPSPTATDLANTPTLDARVADPPRIGEAIIRGGPEAQYGPKPSLEDSVGGTLDRAEGLLVDQNAPVYRTIQDLHGTSIADRFEEQQMTSAVAVSNDVLSAETSGVIKPMLDVVDMLQPQDKRAFLGGMWMSSNNAQNRIRLNEAMAEELRLTNKIANTNTSAQSRAAATRQLAELQQDIQRFITDQRSARPRIPDISMQEENDFVNVFHNDMSPQAVKFRETASAINKQMLDVQVESGELSRQAADDMHRLNPYYVHAVNDPLKNKTGAARLWEAASQGFNRTLTRQSEGSGASALHESPLRHLDKGIPKEKVPGAPETRVTMPKEPISAMRDYVERTLRSANLTRTRNEAINLLAWDGPAVNGVKSRFYTDGHMRIVHAPGGREWWTGQELSRAAEAMRAPNVVAEWQNGNMRLWEFGDHAIAQSLRMEAAQLTGAMKFISQTTNVMKAFTTGRFAPWFAPLGAMYNTIIGMMTRLPGRSFGSASYLSHRFLPKTFNKYVTDRLPDISQPLTMPYHLVRAVVELQAYHLTQPIVRQLIKSSPFATLQQAVGAPQFSKMVNTMLRVASWAEQSPSVLLHRAGATVGHQTVDNIPSVRTAFHQIHDSVPSVVKGAWQFYKDGLDAIYLADKRMYYTQNYALLDLKYKKLGQAVPSEEIEKLVRETRVLAGDMAKVPGLKGMQDLERILPYLTQTKLGAYHLMRHMGSKETAGYVIPRAIAMTNLVAGSFYMMTYWNEEARKEFWDRTPEYQRWKYAYIPTLKLMTAWANGENMPYSRDLYYKVPIPPDIAPMVAGTVAMWQMLGAIPADATPKPIANDLFKILSDNLTPAMPPLAQVVLGASGMRLDPQSSETRGGDWIRNMAPRFKSGPQAEAKTNLGQVSNSTALMMNGMFGATGASLVAGMDVMLHAGKFRTGAGQAPTPRESFDFAAGLKAATTEVFELNKGRVPDVPLLWQNKEKYATSTQWWKEVKQQDTHVQNIKDMRNDMMGKAAQRKQELAKAAGGIPPQAMTDVVLGQLANEINTWQNPTGELGKLKKQYGELAVQSRSVQSQYNLPQDARRERNNQIVKLMQDNMMQQYLATKNAEELIAHKYGQALAPVLNGRAITFGTINRIMRESIGSDKSMSMPPAPTDE